MVTTRKLSFVLIAIALLVSLTACSAGAFNIQGTWKSVGETGWGQAQPGAIVRFGNGQANLFSPQDTYALYQDSGSYKLEVTGILGGTTSFRVEVISRNKIELYIGANGTPSVVLERVS